jgi:hypothetical protein
VGLRDLFRTKASPPEPTWRLRLERREWDTEGESGEELHGLGYSLLDEHDRIFAWDDPLLAASGAEVVKVAGTSHRGSELQDDAFAPGSPLLLRAEPDNRYDKNAVGVWDARGHVQVGYVPRERSHQLARRLGRGERLDVLSLWEWRDAHGKRCGLRLLVCPLGLLAEQPTPLAEPPARR